MMAGLIELTRAPRSPQRTASAITRSTLPASKADRHAAGLRLRRAEGRQVEQRVRRRRRERTILLRRQRAEPMSGVPHCDGRLVHSEEKRHFQGEEEPDDVNMAVRRNTSRTLSPRC